MASKPPAKKSRTETDSLRADQRARQPLLGRADAALDRQFPHRRGSHAGAAGARDRHRQARGGRNQHGARLARYQARPRHRARRAGSDRRHARGAFSARGLADRLRHAEQHECQRGDLQPRDRNARRRARLEKPGASQRSRQYEPVVERQLPDRDAYRGGGRDHAPAHSGARRICIARCRKRKRNLPRS